MDKDPHIEAMLKAHTPTLTAHEREVLWSALEKKLPPQTSIPSPYTFTFSKTKSMSALILIAVLILGGSGTTYAANAARPGDTLFPLERALENTQLRLALSDDSRNVLRTKLADERISELREILSEAARTQNSASSTTEASSTQEQQLISITRSYRSQQATQVFLILCLLYGLVRLTHRVRLFCIS